MEIVEDNADVAWRKALKFIFSKGEDFTDRDNRVCREIINLNVTVNDVKSIVKPIEIINSFKKWAYPPLDELRMIALSRKEVPGYYYNYGARAFNFEGINQIEDYIIPLLKKDKTSRRATAVFYNPAKDSSLFKKDIPARILVNFNIRNGKLNVINTIRSNDMFFGWPANLYQVFVIQDYVAKQVGCEPGVIVTHSISAHLFDDQFDYIKKII